MSSYGTHKLFRRYKCPAHVENTPSLVVYDDHGWCYGCSTYFSIEELKKHGIEVTAGPRYVEDVAETIKRISTLPVATIRGLELPHDNVSYYIVFPNANFYKRRFTHISGHPHKYYSPAGIQKPLFIAQDGGRDTLYIIEGELNALSLVKAGVQGTLVSPGGSNDFLKKDYLTYYRDFDKIVIIVDKDPSGVKAAIMLKETLKRTGKYDIVTLEMEQDANEQLQEKGAEKLKEEIERLSR